MKQRSTFSFRLNSQEKRYAKQYLHANKRLLLLDGAILVMLVSGMLLPEMVMEIGFSLFEGYNNGIQSDSYQIELYMLSTCILAYILPIFQFHFLMKRTSSDLYLSLPIRRERLFYVHYVIGAGILIALSLFLGGCYLVFWIGWELSYWLIALVLMMVLMTLSFLLYTFFTLLVMKCHTMLDAILVCIAYTFLPVILHFALKTFFNQISDQLLLSYIYYGGIELSFHQLSQYFSVLLSLPWLMIQWIDLVRYGVGLPFAFLVIETLAWMSFCGYCFVWAKRSFVNIKSEESGQPSKSFVTYPLILPILAFILMLNTTKGTILSFPMALIFLSYLIAYFFAQRKIKWSLRMMIPFVACMVLSTVTYHVCYSTNLFGMVYEIPTNQGISEAVIYICEVQQEILEEENLGYNESQRRCYTSETRYMQDEIEKIQMIHKQILPSTSKDDYDIGYKNRNFYRITFEYYKNTEPIYQETNTNQNFTKVEPSDIYAYRGYLVLGNDGIGKIQNMVEKLKQDGFLIEEVYE